MDAEVFLTFTLDDFGSLEIVLDHERVCMDAMRNIALDATLPPFVRKLRVHLSY
jgi:hypothetical protein